MTNPTQQLTASEAVEIVARRDGWVCPECKGSGQIEDYSFKDGSRIFRNCRHKHQPDYLNSRDALQPVLEKMTEEEWTSLDRIIAEQWRRAMCVSSFMRFLLTLPARTLCLAVAAVIHETETQNANKP